MCNIYIYTSVSCILYVYVYYIAIDLACLAFSSAVWYGMILYGVVSYRIVLLCHVSLCHAISCYVMQRHILLFMYPYTCRCIDTNAHQCNIHVAYVPECVYIKIYTPYIHPFSNSLGKKLVANQAGQFQKVKIAHQATRGVCKAGFAGASMATGKVSGVPIYIYIEYIVYLFSKYLIQ